MWGKSTERVSTLVRWSPLSVALLLFSRTPLQPCDALPATSGLVRVQLYGELALLLAIQTTRLGFSSLRTYCPPLALAF